MICLMAGITKVAAQKISLFAEENKMQKYFKEAIEGGSKEKINMYLDSGINLNAVWDLNDSGMTPLFYCIKLNKLDLAELLIKKGANVNLKFSFSEFYVGNYNMSAHRDVVTNALSETIKLGNFDGVKLLLANGANKSESLEVAKKSNEKIINLFKENGATISYTTSDLENAAESKDYKTIKEIVDQGVRGSGWALLSAVNRSDKTIIELILKSGVSVNETVYTKTGASWCAMCTAVNNGNLDIVKYLVEEKNANINVNCQIKDYAGNSSQTLTEFSDSPNCWRRNKNITEYLLLAPTIQKKKTEEKKEKTKEYISKFREFLKNNDLVNAKKEYDNAFSLSGGKDYLYETEVIEYYYYENNFDKVLKIADDFDSKKSNFNIQAYCAYAYMKLKNNEKAFELLKKCSELLPNSISSELNFADYYANIENYEETYNCLKKAFELGFKNFDSLEKNEDLNSFRQTKEYNKLVRKYKK